MIILFVGKFIKKNCILKIRWYWHFINTILSISNNSYSNDSKIFTITNIDKYLNKIINKNDKQNI